MTRLLAFLFLLLFTAPVAAQPQSEPVRIVASFTILADMIRQVGDDLVEVETLIGPDQEAHEFEPLPQMAAMLAKADIIAINGLRLEDWMHKLIKASGTKAKLLVATAGVRPRLLSADEGHHHKHEHEPEHEHDNNDVIPDPHAWQDLGNARVYIKNIAAALIEARPDQAEAIKARARAYLAQCNALDKQAKETFAAIPADKRKVITSHDAFGYFARAYGITFLAPAGISDEDEPSAADLAGLTDQIKQENIKAVFLEKAADARLMKQIAQETGAQLSGTLYADALTKEDGAAPTYLAMMRHNIEAIADAFR